MTPEQEKLVLDHQHLVLKIVRRCLRIMRAGTALNTEDLISEGYLALIEIAQKYNPDKDTMFKTLANVIIPYRLVDYLRRIDCLTRNQRRKLRKDFAGKEINVRRKTRSLAPQEDGWILQIPTGVGSAKDVMDLPEEFLNWEKIDVHTPEVDVNRKEALRLIKSLGLKYLGKRNLDILLELYIEEETAVDLAKKYDLNASRISQINTKNMAILRKQLVQRGYSQLNHLL